MKAEEYYHYSYFKTPSPWAEKCLLVSDGMGYTADAGFRIDRRTFYNHLAFYVHRGTFYLEQYGKKFVLHSGDVGIMDLMDAHLYYSDPEDITHLLWFHFRGAGTDQIMESLKRSEALPLLYHNTEREQDFLRLLSLRKSGCSETEMAGNLYGLLMNLLSEAPENSVESSGIPDELQRAARYMEEKYRANLSLDQISETVGMTKYHFCHTFKKWYGISPMQYYTVKKMEQACRLLREGNYSIDEAAGQLGYLETGYFRKAFKKYFGITPAAYRNLCR